MEAGRDTFIYGHLPEISLQTHCPSELMGSTERWEYSKAMFRACSRRGIGLRQSLEEKEQLSLMASGVLNFGMLIPHLGFVLSAGSSH